MSGITTHVLDTARGRPAAGIAVTLAARDGEGWREMADGETDADGRVKEFPGAGAIAPGTYRLRFAVAEYQKGAGTESFWPWVDIVFDVTGGHYHVPLLLAPYGYSTYRGT